jgi:hypothetical protein
MKILVCGAGAMLGRELLPREQDLERYLGEREAPAA